MLHFSFRLLCIFFLAIAGAERAWGYLGSFEEQDGYRVPQNGNMASLGFSGDAQFYLNNQEANGFTGIVPPGALPNTLGDPSHGADLSRYNAGQYGTNAGGPGGAGMDIADNSGLWQALAGGRLHEDIGAPFYQGSLSARDYVQAYGYPGARTGSQVLNFLASDVNLRYNYTLDSRDFGGLSPALTVAHQVDLSFWLCPSEWDDPDTGDMMGMAFRDSSGQVLLEVGYTGDNRFQYRVGGSASWITSGIVLGSQGWSEVAVTLDTHGNTAGLTVTGYDDSNSMLSAPVTLLTESALGLDALALTDLTWDLRGGSLDNGAVGFKHYFDDFSFALTPVPEPTGALLLMLTGLVAGLRRRR